MWLQIWHARWDISTSHLFLLKIKTFKSQEHLLQQRHGYKNVAAQASKEKSTWSLSRISCGASVTSSWRALRRLLLEKLCRPHLTSKTWRRSNRRHLGYVKFKTPVLNLWSARLKTIISVTLLPPYQRGRACQKLRLSPSKLLSCHPWWQVQPLWKRRWLTWKSS